MKLKVGMYIRTNYGKIDKIFKITESYVQGVSQKDEFYVYAIDSIIKASFDIIDLIEIGDAFKFKELRTRISNESNTKYYENYIFDVHNEQEFKVIKQEIRQGKIKLLEIVTRQQFEQMSYKLEEIKNEKEINNIYNFRNNDSNINRV